MVMSITMCKDVSLPDVNRIGLALLTLLLAFGVAPGSGEAQNAAPQEHQDRSPYLDLYVGRYQLTERHFLDITRVGDALYVKATGQGEVQLTPRSETEFVIVGGSLRLMFGFNSRTGEVDHLIFEQGGMGRRAERLAAADIPAAPVAVDLAPDVLARYVGTYEEQPGFAITVSLDDGHLVAGMEGLEAASILPESETEFFYEDSSATLSFELDADGRANRLILHQGGSDLEMQRLDN